MHRFFADTAQIDDNTIRLASEDARHAVTVLRLKKGSHIELIMDRKRWEAEITDVAGHEVFVRLISELPTTEPSLSVTLFQGLPKSDKMDWIVQKATELGVTRIVPVLMSRCVARPDPKDFSRKRERWQKIVREAAKQSGRCIIPEITDLVGLQHLFCFPAFPETSIVPWEEADGFGPLAFRKTHPELSSLGILIGPEGGIDAQEISVLRSSGFIPVTLGKRILRTETAGLAAVAGLMSLYGEMES